jgi:broad specificity phosphatase PhoE
VSDVPWEPALRGEGLALALVRHGQTAWNVERRFLGRTDLPLDAVGEAQVAELGRTVGCRFDRVYSSPLARARATAAHLGHPEPELIDDLAEMAQGDVEGLLREEALARFPGMIERWLEDPVMRSLPGGESLQQTRDRAWAAFEAITARHRDGEIVAVVSHQMVISAISCSIADHPLSGWRDHAVPNATATWIIRDRGGFRIVARGRGPTP